MWYSQGKETKAPLRKLLMDEVTLGSEETEPDASSKVRHPHPPGFKEFRERVRKFNGKRGDNDFCIWLADFEEASEDRKWTNDLRAKWFSWFVDGLAKATYTDCRRENVMESNQDNLPSKIWCP